MSSAQTNPKPKDNGGRKLVADLVFTLLIPVFILSPNGFGSGIVMADLLGGTVNAYIAAALVPVAYTLYDLLVNRRVSPVAIFAGAGALVTGALAFWFVDGPLYALKDSALRFIIAAFAVASVWFGYPLFRIFLDASSLTAKPEERAALTTALGQANVVRALGLGTYVFALVELVAGTLNYVVNLRIVTAKFGSTAFNAQVAEANAVMRLPSIALFLVGFGLAAWVVQRAVTARYGKGASLFEPAGLVAKVAEEG